MSFGRNTLKLKPSEFFFHYLRPFHSVTSQVGRPLPFSIQRNIRTNLTLLFAAWGHHFVVKPVLSSTNADTNTVATFPTSRWPPSTQGMKTYQGRSAELSYLQPQELSSLCTDTCQYRTTADSSRL